MRASVKARDLRRANVWQVPSKKVMRVVLHRLLHVYAEKSSAGFAGRAGQTYDEKGNPAAVEGQHFRVLAR